MEITLDHEASAIEFGRFTLRPQSGELLQLGARPVTLGARATAVLIALIGARGNVLSQEELMEAAWPGQDIHASNLRVQIAALRRALEDERDMIGTVAGRGYVFSGPAGVVRTARPPEQLRTYVLPLPMVALIGRARHLDEVCERLSRERLLTLCGTGGIGKTLLALAAAHRLAARPGGEACWVDLSNARDAHSVMAALGQALGLRDGDGGLLACLGRQPLLLVLDNCEQVADAIARLVETLLQRCPQLRILTTSRQPLLVCGETVWRVPPLAVPDAGEDDLSRILCHSAVQLFIARAHAADSEFGLTPPQALMAATICRRLEGVPLAIELAAACIPMLGVEQTAAGLDDMLSLLRRGRRNAPLRHRTLRGAMDWSHTLLSDTARAALRHLAGLQGGFTLDEAVAALEAHGLTCYEAIDGLAGLVSHSMAVVDHRTYPARYRLLEMARLYGLDRLREAA